MFPRLFHTYRAKLRLWPITNPCNKVSDVEFKDVALLSHYDLASNVKLSRLFKYHF